MKTLTITLPDGKKIKCRKLTALEKLRVGDICENGSMFKKESICIGERTIPTKKKKPVVRAVNVGTGRPRVQPAKGWAPSASGRISHVFPTELRPHPFAFKVKIVPVGTSIRRAGK